MQRRIPFRFVNLGSVGLTGLALGLAAGVLTAPVAEAASRDRARQTATLTASATLANTIALSNCSASLVRYPTSVSTDRALMLTNGHCLSTMPTAGQVITNQASSRTGTLLRSNGTSAGTVTADRLLYATMTGTDIALYRLTETYAALGSRTGGAAITISDARPADGTPFSIPSSYHKRVWTGCTLTGFTNLREGEWSFTDSIRYDANCDTIPGSSGSPIISDTTGLVIGINNTGNEDGAMCTVNNPCEVAADGTTTAHQGQSYGQQTWWITTCLSSSRQIDLTVPGCKLAGATSTPPPTGGQVLGNPGFETGTAAPWSASSGVIDSSTSQPARTGSWKAWLNGYGTTHTDTLTQSVTIPSGCTSATLSFYLHIDTAETTTSVAYDKLTVKIGSTTLATYSNLNKAAGYQLRSFNVSSFVGQTVTISFSGVEDSSLQTSFVIDDTALNAC